ncbi:hypothetical protein WM40_10360 [Robbsia andropogonis]|uniref:Uncharacterized protein n=1 Tax=Robbsia andropogonis TaxID=28092 RepID=A0A0F5K1B4_9BURK|nr:exodeoxyribonuclease VII small subunit [Robbsia andropogonis]KKB63710.1 hypothetical protein WM40_10360 [Robbsia andropogonis]MCP1119275.1 hypothetical protein [Robbsia andropogonis]MCP1129115.1 hypothetical protein [Robbsia andropogonis]
MAEQTFKSAYGILKKHADALRTQQEPNIDDLLSIVNESVEAYKVCKARIDAVEAALEQALREGAYEESAEMTPVAASADERDDDVPF